MEEFFEYAVRTERPGRRPHVVEFSRFHGDAEAYRRHEATQWGEERVHLLTRVVRRTRWQQATNVPALPVAAAS